MSSKEKEVPGTTSVRVCLYPPPESIGTNRMEYYLPHELVMIGCGKRIDSVQPKKNSRSRKRKKKCCTPFSCLGGPNGPTEREQINSRLFDADGHHLLTEDGCGHVDTNLLWHVQKIPFVPIRLARRRILHGPKHVFLDRNGTNYHEQPQPRSVPLGPMLFGRS